MADTYQPAHHMMFYHASLMIVSDSNLTLWLGRPGRTGKGLSGLQFALEHLLSLS